MTEERNTNPPVHKERCGSISVDVWENKGTNKDGKEFTFQNVSIQRNYQKDEKWESSTIYGLRVNDLPKAILALQRTYEHLVTKKGE